jgi:hypothetical protein
MAIIKKDRLLRPWLRQEEKRTVFMAAKVADKRVSGNNDYQEILVFGYDFVVLIRTLAEIVVHVFCESVTYLQRVITRAIAGGYEA